MKLGIKDHQFIMPEAKDTGLEPPLKKTKTLFDFIAENTVEIDIDKDINKYLAASCLPISIKPANFWNENDKEYPSFATIAKKFLSVPSSSAPVESIFSIAGKVSTPARCRLKDRGFNNLCSLDVTIQ